MTTYYFTTTSKGRAGCSHYTYRKCEAKSKAEVKRRYSSKFSGRRVQWVITEDELNQLSAESQATIRNNAI